MPGHHLRLIQRQDALPYRPVEVRELRNAAGHRHHLTGMSTGQAGLPHQPLLGRVDPPLLPPPTASAANSTNRAWAEFNTPTADATSASNPSITASLAAIDLAVEIADIGT